MNTEKMTVYLTANISKDLAKLHRDEIKLLQSIEGHAAELESKKGKLEEIKLGIRALQDLEREASMLLRR